MLKKTVFVRLAGMWNSVEQLPVQHSKSLKRVANAINTLNSFGHLSQRRSTNLCSAVNELHSV